MWSRTKRHLGTATRKLERVGERPMLDADIEGEAVLRHTLHASTKPRLHAEGRVALDLDQPPDAAHVAVLFNARRSASTAAPFSTGAWATMPESLEHPCSAIPGRRPPPQDAGRGRPRLPRTRSCRPRRLPRAASNSSRRWVLLRCFGALSQPAVAEAVRCLKMHMAVDDREFSALLSSCSSATEEPGAGSTSRRSAKRRAIVTHQQIWTDVRDPRDTA